MIAEYNALARIEDGAIVFGDGHYDISLAECATSERVLRWVFHLAAKSWVDGETLRRFILLASKHHGFKIIL